MRLRSRVIRESFTVLTWTRDSIETWRDMSVIIGQNFETTRIFDRDSIHARRDMSLRSRLIIKSFTVMTWTPESTHGWRDMSVAARHDYEWNPCYDHDSIHLLGGI
jgi:hypothetical protein